MEAEYKARVQGKQEDVQNYINAKYELFQLARPNAQDRDREEFHGECTEGFLNKYVRDQLFAYEPASVEAFRARAVVIVQVEHRRIRIGDSATSNTDGLIPVTKPVQDPGRGRQEEAMQVDHLGRPQGRGATSGSESDGECECMALQEHGFRGSCFYCQKRGYMARTCPRKSVGLPKIYRPGEMGGECSKRSGYPVKRRLSPQESRRGAYGSDKGRRDYPKSKPPSRQQDDGSKGRGRGGEGREEDETEQSDKEGVERAAHFLEDLTL